MTTNLNKGLCGHLMMPSKTLLRVDHGLIVPPFVV